MTAARSSVRRVLAEPGTPYGRLTLAGLLGLASALATIGLLAGSGYVVGRAALRPGLNALVGILALVEVLAFLRGPLRYAERLVGHDAALRALTTWRVWLYDRLAPRVPAALAGWRSGDLLARAVDDVDTLQDLYLRTALPAGIAVGAAVVGTVAVGVVLPWAALALGLPLGIALVLPAALTWRAGAAPERAALSGELSSHVVDALAGAPELLAFGAHESWVGDAEELGARSDALERRQARVGATATVLVQVCLAAAVTGVLAVTVAAVAAHHVGQVMVAVLPLAALATFETVPGVPQAMARALAVRASAERLFALADVPVPIHDVSSPDPTPRGVPAVTFAEVCVRYAPDLPRALDGVTADLPAGHSLAITGSSGAGKSSLVNALMRFWPLEAGSLALDGSDVARLRQDDVRAMYALADQRAQMFAGIVAREPHARPSRGHRRRSGDRARGGLPRPMGRRAPCRTRHPGRGRRRRSLGRRTASPRRGTCAPGRGARADPRRAHERPRPRVGRRALGPRVWSRPGRAACW